MRKLVVDHKDFEWLVGHSFVRIRGNGHVADVKLEDFYVDAMGVPEKDAHWRAHSEHRIPVQPSDVVNYIHKHGWSS